MRDSQLNIGIAGGGLLGRLLAWRLLKLGHKVTLHEAGSLVNSTAAANTAAAMISPLSELVSSDKLIYDMGMDSLSKWPQWLEELTTPVSFVKNGSIAVAHPQDHSELLQLQKDLQFQLGDSSQYQWLTQREIQSLEPTLQNFSSGIFLREEAHLDNRLLLPVLLEEIRNLGGQCYENSPVEVTDNTLAGQQFDWALDCRGIGAKPVYPDFRGVRGEVLWVETKEVSLQRPVRMMHPRYKLYIVPKPNHQFIIGATELESEDTSPISLQSSLELSSALYSINPAFAEARMIETDVNLRPAFMDNHPRINIDKEAQVMRVNGLYRHGYLLAPTVVEHALAALLETTEFISSEKKLAFTETLIGSPTSSVHREVTHA